jgi:hypothetical protein
MIVLFPEKRRQKGIFKNGKKAFMCAIAPETDLK